MIDFEGTKEPFTVLTGQHPLCQTLELTSALHALQFHSDLSPKGPVIKSPMLSPASMILRWMKPGRTITLMNSWCLNYCTKARHRHFIKTHWKCCLWFQLTMHSMSNTSRDSTVPIEVRLDVCFEEQLSQLPVWGLAHGFGPHAHLVLVRWQFVSARLLMPQVEEATRRSAHHHQFAV